MVAVPAVAVAGDSHPDRTQAAKHAIKGGKARNALGVTNQTDLFFTMKRALRV